MMEDEREREKRVCGDGDARKTICSGDMRLGLRGGRLAIRTGRKEKADNERQKNKKQKQDMTKSKEAELNSM